MMLLWSLLAATAVLAQKQKFKTPSVCYGLIDDDHFECKKLDAEACEEDDKCKFGRDRVAEKTNKMKKCMDKEKVQIGKVCTKNEECKCGTRCILIEWMKKSVCSSCKDAGIEEDCMAFGEHMGCMWNEGECYPSKNECNEMDKKACAMSMKCKYDKKYKMCLLNYEPSCVGTIDGNHPLCVKQKTKEDCMALVKVNVLLNKKTFQCKWGFNDKDTEGKMKKCVDKEGGMGKVCETQGDCECGTTCYTMFGAKSCMLCADFGIKEDCNGAAEKMGCKWVGGDEPEDGMCLKKDACKEMMHDGKDKCLMNKMCGYDEEKKCFMKSITKKTCKKAGGKGKSKDTPEKKDEKKGMCQMIPECKWTVEEGNKKKEHGVCEFRG